MDISSRRQLQQAVEAVELVSDNKITWFDVPSHGLSPEVAQAVGPSMVARHVSHQLAEILYSYYYCPGVPVDHGQLRGRLLLGTDFDFVAELVDANNGTGHLDPGWKVVSASAFLSKFAPYVIESQGLRIQAPLDRLEARRGGLVPGAAVALRSPNGSPGVSPGFYVAMSETPFPRAERASMVRIYLHLERRGVLEFVRAATFALNGQRIPYLIKALCLAGTTVRCDTVVLNIQRSDYDSVVRNLSPIFRRLQAHFGRRTPALTKPLGPGIAVAEDPGGGASFGQHRCALIAEGLLGSLRRNARASAQDRLSGVASIFDDHNLVLESPYLGEDSVDDYKYLTAAFGHSLPRHASGPGHRKKPRSRGPVEVAADIGRRLIETAAWYEGRCNWIGPAGGEARTRPNGSVASLGPDLYSGTSGVALFLASLYTATGDPGFRHTALGAINHALCGIDQISPELRAGAYMGVSGIALAARQVAMATVDDSVLERVATLMGRDQGAFLRSPGLEWLSGAAGTLSALAQMGVQTRDTVAGTADLVSRLGILMTSSQLSDMEVEQSDGSTDLGGFAHGCAGVAFSLLRTYQLFGDARLRDVAIGTMERISAAVTAATDRSKDEGSGSVGTERIAKPRSSGWCYGPPGVALACLLAFEETATPCHEAAAIALLDESGCVTQRWLESGIYDLCLCHGMAGSLEVLRHGAKVLDSSRWTRLDLVDAGTSAICERVAGEVGCDGPNGVAPRDPGLMQGMAGVGLFCLQSADPTVLSALTLG